MCVCVCVCVTQFVLARVGKRCGCGGEVKDQHYFRRGVVIVCADAQSCGWNATVCCQMTCRVVRKVVELLSLNFI